MYRYACHRIQGPEPEHELRRCVAALDCQSGQSGRVVEGLGTLGVGAPADVAFVSAGEWRVPAGGLAPECRDRQAAIVSGLIFRGKIGTATLIKKPR
jgi:hypothetical protein